MGEFWTFQPSRLTSSAARSTASIDLVSAAAVSAYTASVCNPPFSMPTHPIALERMTGTEVQHSTSTRATSRSHRIVPLPVRIFYRCLHMFVIFAGELPPTCIEESRTNRMNSHSCRFHGNSRVLAASRSSRANSKLRAELRWWCRRCPECCCGYLHNYL